MPQETHAHKKENIRQEYLYVMAQTQAHKHASTDSTASLYALYEKTNTLLTHIETPSELYLDARVSGEVLDMSNKQLTKLCTGKLVTLDEFTAIMHSKEAKQRAEEYAHSVYRGIRFPPVLNIEGEEKEKRERKIHKKEAEHTAQRPDKKQSTELEQIDAPQKVKAIYRAVKQAGRIELLRLVVHPGDFARTVENMLYLSFAVKLERAYISHSSTNTEVDSSVPCMYVTAEKEEETDKSHAILSITQAEAEDAVQKYNIEHAMIE